MPLNSLLAWVVALPHEAQAFLPKIKVQARTDYRGAQIHEGTYQGRPVVLLVTGMGPRNALRATQYLLDHYKISLLISTGYCGGLQKELKAGDGILATEVVDLADLEAPIYPNGPIDKLKKTLENKIGQEIWQGRLIQSDVPVLSPEGKHHLGQESQALAVDMESFSVLKALAAKEKIASLVLRFVVDEAHLNLADTSSWVNSEGDVKVAKVLGETLRKPSLILSLPKLERRARKARNQMAKAMELISSSDLC